MAMLTESLSLGLGARAKSARRAPSRVIFAAHRTNFASHRRFEERHAAYYAARARGGAGMVVLESVTIHPSDWPYEYAPIGYDAECVVGYRAIAEAIHAHGALALASLGHTGGQGTSHYSQLPLWAPSPVPEVNSREVPMEMEPGDIDVIVRAFASAAALAAEAGLDGVEINAGQSSLLRQFLSPLTNRRSDDHGGSLENRARLTARVLSAVREAVGPDLIVGLRVSGDEYAPWAGLVPETAAEATALLVKGDGEGRARADFVSVTSGSIYSQHMTRAGLHAAPGHAAHLAALVKARVGVPVLAQGSIVDVAMAESLLASGQADAVEMTRALIADPELVAKVREGRAADIRPCVLCNQDCVVETVQNPASSCIQNPAAGHEAAAEFAPLRPAAKKKHVLVLGAGPAGMEAARVARLRGHEVTVVGDRLGGAVRIAAAAPGRARLGLVADWLEAQLRALGVTLREETLQAAQIEALAATHRADVVVHCTGAQPAPRRFLEVEPAAHVSTPRDVLSGRISERDPAGPGRKAVVLDEPGDHAAMGAAEWLADNGWDVTVVTADMFVGQRLTATLELTPWNQRAAAKKIAFRPQLEVTHVREGEVLLVDVFSRAKVTLEADLVIDASYEVPRDGAPGSAGDAVAPRSIGHAILEGHRLGRAL